MTDPRKLAERLGRAHTIADYERILREDREALLRELQAGWNDPRVNFDEYMVRVLEGGEQDEGNNSTSSQRGGHVQPSPAAPDPHEYRDPWRDGVVGLMCGACGRPADDPIHEVSDGNSGEDRSSPVAGGGGVVDGSVSDGGVEPPPVTVGPGDEVMDHEQYYEVLGRDRHLNVWGIRCVTGNAVVLVPIERYRTPDGRPVSGFKERYHPVSAAVLETERARIAELEREVENERTTVRTIVSQRDQAIENAERWERELEVTKRSFKEMTVLANDAIRERNEARVRLDGWEFIGDGVAVFGKDNRARVFVDRCWVRLDDETIERVTRQILAYACSECSEADAEDIFTPLRDLRDGRLNDE